MLGVSLLLLFLPHLTSSDFLADYFRHRSALGNDYMYEYYDGGVLSGGTMFANKDTNSRDVADFDYGSETTEESVDICAMDPSKTKMLCKCDREIKIHCIIFADIPSDGAVWDAFAEYSSIEFLHFTPRPFGQEWLLPVRVLRYLPKLRSLIIRHTKMTDLKMDAMSQLSEINNIELNNNHIETMEPGAFNDLPSLEQLALSENFLTKIQTGTFTEMPKLRALYLDRNNISVIEDDVFAALGNLLELDLWANQIQEINRMTFNGLHRLHRLDLTSNRIRRLDSETFVSVPRLHELLLQENLISVIEPGTFDNLPNLVLLKLTGNRLTTLSGMPFQHLSSLMLLDVRENSMKMMTSSVLMSIPNIHKERMNVHIEENPLVCNCSLFWLRQLLDSNITSTLKTAVSLVRCGGPDESMLGLNLTQVTWPEEDCQEAYHDNQVLPTDVQKDEKLMNSLIENEVEMDKLIPSVITRVDNEIPTNINQHQHSENTIEKQAVEKTKENKNICTLSVPNIGLTLASITTLLVLHLIPMIVN